jgi:hypothetical protein
LLEYNANSKSLERCIDRIARHVGVNVQTVVGYREVTLTLVDGRAFYARVPELRINVAVSATRPECPETLPNSRSLTTETPTAFRHYAPDEVRSRDLCAQNLLGLRDHGMNRRGVPLASALSVAARQSDHV